MEPIETFEKTEDNYLKVTTTIPQIVKERIINPSTMKQRKESLNIQMASLNAELAKIAFYESKLSELGITPA